MEVPEPPSPPPRRRGGAPSAGAGRGRRVQSTSEASGSNINRQRSPLLGAAGQAIASQLGSYADQYRRDQFGIPEILSKGLSDINSTVYSTVNELRVRRISILLL